MNIEDVKRKYPYVKDEELLKKLLHFEKNYDYGRYFVSFDEAKKYIERKNIEGFVHKRGNFWYLVEIKSQRKRITSARKKVMRTWITAQDDRVCYVCKQLHGVTLDDERKKFKAITEKGKMLTFEGPPAHPNCRCVLYIHS